MVETSTSLSRDLVADAISRPIDWGRFEALVHAILVADDFPRLEKIGGTNDHGMDAVEESFYNGHRKIETVVQVTSASAQRVKLRDTIEKLQKNGINCRTLVFVSRHPVTSENRRQMIADGEDAGVAVEIRDDAYLIAQLSKPESIIFPRFFGSTKDQFDALVSRPDPLKTTSSKTQHALLATLGAFVLSPRARLARNTLFDKTLLAVVSSAPEGITLEAAALELGQLSGPKPTQDQVRAAADRLVAEGACSEASGLYRCSEAILASFVRVANSAESGFQELVAYVRLGCEQEQKLTDAQAGYLERNIRRALLHLLRASGPIKDYEKTGLSKLNFNSDELLKILGRDLPPAAQKRALVAMSTFASDPTNSRTLAPLIRSYCALAMRNIDPWGRRWQKQAMSRNIVALDTDAVLHLLVEELPEHKALLTALNGLQAEGVQLVIPEHVLEEAIGHIGRFHRTFLRFSSYLVRMPQEAVDARVWHAVVRGFYYASKRGFKGAPDEYLAKYWDPNNPRAFVEHLLGRRLTADIKQLDTVPDHLWDDLNELELVAMDFKERNRMKAEFRDPITMAARVRADVSMALNLAERSTQKIGANAKGYLATSDRAFKIIERNAAWKKRERVAVETRVVPEMASFICGTSISDDEVVELLFHPVSVAAAEQMADDITVLTSIGVDLADKPLDRLEWDLSHSLRQRIEGLEQAVVSDATTGGTLGANAALELMHSASAAGYKLAKPVETLITDYDEARRTASEERERRAEIEGKMKALVEGALKTTSKGRTRIHALVKALGIEIHDSN